MPQIIQQSYNPDNSLSKAIASLGDALSPSPANQLAFANMAKLKLQQELGAQAGPLAVRAAQGDRQAAAELAGIGVQYDPSAANTMPYLRYGGVQGLDPNSPGYNRSASQHAFATGAGYQSTPQGAADAEAAALQRQTTVNAANVAAQRETANIQAQNALRMQQDKLAAEETAKDREEIWVEGPDKRLMLTTRGALRNAARGGGSGAVAPQPAAPGVASPAPGAPAGAGGPSPAPAAPVNPGFQPRPDTAVVTKQLDIDQANAVAAAEREAKLNAPVQVIDRATNTQVVGR